MRFHIRAKVASMTTSSETLLHRWLAAGDAGDLDAFDDCLHPDVVVHAPLGLSTDGIEAEREAWRATRAALPDLRHDIRETLTFGATIAARVVVTGRHEGEFLGIPPTGKRFQIDQAVFAHLRDGKAEEIWEIVDSARFLQQIGVLTL